jgi:hypothetical protein
MTSSRSVQILQGLGVALIILLALLFSYKDWVSRPSAWLIVVGLLLILCIVLGVWIMKLPMGILISERNLMSLSRLQMVGWTLVIFSAYVVIVMQRIAHHIPHPLDVTLDTNLWAVLGISTASLVGTPLILSTKTDSSPNAGAVRAASNTLQESPASIQQNAQGTLYSNAAPSEARFSDIFQGDEIGNTAYVDISKVQMFLLTVLLVGSYCSDIWNSLGQPVDKLTQLPEMSANMLKLLAVSHAGYLTFKAVSHTDTTSK